jgi:hypothetical protein
MVAWSAGGVVSITMLKSFDIGSSFFVQAVIVATAKAIKKIFFIIINI